MADKQPKPKTFSRNVPIGSAPSDNLRVSPCEMPGRIGDLNLVIEGPREGWLYGQYLSREQAVAVRDALTAILKETTSG